MGIVFPFVDVTYFFIPRFRSDLLTLGHKRISFSFFILISYALSHEGPKANLRVPKMTE